MITVVLTKWCRRNLTLDNTPVLKIIREELHVKIFVCCWVPHDLTEHQKAARVKIGKEILKLLNDKEHCLISKTMPGDKHSYRLCMFQYFKKVKYWSLKMALNEQFEKTTSSEKSNVCHFLQKYKSGQIHQAGRIENSYS